MNESQLANRFWQDGYLVLENFFDLQLMDKYHQLILDYFGENPEFYHNQEFLSKASTEVIPWFPQREGINAFDKIADDPLLNALTQEILGTGWGAQYCMVMFSKQGTRGQAWHQDCPPDNTDIFNMNRLVYTNDIVPEIGGLTLVVPGSHRRGILSVGDPLEDFQDQVVLAPAKGTLVLLHGHTWHRVLPVNGPYRVSTNYRCGPAGTPEDVTDICVYRNMLYQFSSNQVVEERV